MEATRTYYEAAPGIFRELEGASYVHSWQEKRKVLILAISDKSRIYEKEITKVAWFSKVFQSQFKLHNFRLTENNFAFQKDALLKSLATFLKGRLAAQCK